MMKRFLHISQLVFLFLFICPENTRADELQQAISLLQNKSTSDKSSAINTLELLSKESPRAQLILGDLYIHGEYVDKNIQRGAQLISAAAQSNLPEAQNLLGWLFATGTGVKASAETAMKWYEKSAKNGLPEGQFNFAETLIGGLNGEKDVVEATHWYRAAGSNGHIDAQFILGRLYFVNQPKESFHWYKKAADQGHAESQFITGKNYLQGVGIKKDVTLALNYFLLGAKNNHSNCKFQLSRMYYEGYGVARNYGKSMQLLAESGLKDADWKQSLSHHLITRFDPITAITAASKGDLESIVDLGWNYFSGTQVTQSKIESYAWFNLAAESTADPKHLWARSYVAKQLSVDELILAKKRAKQIFSLYRFKKTK